MTNKPTLLGYGCGSATRLPSFSRALSGPVSFCVDVRLGDERVREWCCYCRAAYLTVLALFFLWAADGARDVG